jgi:hypothetical protein
VRDFNHRVYNTELQPNNLEAIHLFSAISIPLGFVSALLTTQLSNSIMAGFFSAGLVFSLGISSVILMYKKTHFLDDDRNQINNFY